MMITGRMFHQVKMVWPNPNTCPVCCSVMFAELPGVETARAMDDESPLAHTINPAYPAETRIA